MKNLSIILIMTVSMFTACKNKPAAEEKSSTPASVVADGNYSVNTDPSSFIHWKGVMLGVKEHDGKVPFKDGNLEIKGGQLVAGNFTADLTSISPLDTNYNEKAGYGPAKLIGHLQSPDFFDTAKFPTATFSITSVEGNTAKGTLTIRGKSNEETLNDISISEANGVLTASGALKFDRKKYDVAFDMPAKDMVISNDIELNIELTGKK